MKSEKLKRKCQSIHLGDGKYLGARTIRMQWFGKSRGRDDYDDDYEDELETLAKLQFKVKAHEYAVMAKLGLVDTDAAAEESNKECKVTLRTDRDLVDEGEEALEEEWNSSLDDPTCDLSVWADLDYWEVESVN
jgi:hypothetical protein